MSDTSYGEIVSSKLIKDNPVFSLMLGLCPTLAVTSSLQNGFWMAVAATGVLLITNTAISLIRSYIPKEVRIPCFITVIAAAVTTVQLMIKAASPELDKALGIFIPLIVVNCFILGRAEAFASKNGAFASMADAIGIGLGFAIALCSISGAREFLGAGRLWGRPIVSLPEWLPMEPAALFVLAPGGFLVVGLIMALLKSTKIRKSERDFAGAMTQEL